MRTVISKIALAWVTVCFVFTGVASASDAPIRPRHVFDVGTELSYIKYKEPGVMEQTGMMSGITGSYTFRDNVMLRAEARYSYGQVDYDGQLSDGTPYVLNDIDDNMLEFRGLAGFDIELSEKTFVTPYTGFGYRYLNDDSSFDAAGYERESNYFYSPVGVEALTYMDNGWSLGATVELDYLWKGLQKSHLGNFLVGLNTLENDQEDGYGLRGSIRLEKKSEAMDWFIEPFVRYWNIDESETDAVTYFGTPIGVEGYEPKNNSTEIGLKFAAKF